MATSETAKPNPMVKPDIPRVLMGRGGYISTEERIKKDEEELLALKKEALGITDEESTEDKPSSEEPKAEPVQAESDTKQKEKPEAKAQEDDDLGAEEKNFKIDILSSRGISQLLDSRQAPVNFEDFLPCSKVTTMLSAGRNIGITLGESPLIRKVLMAIKPKNIDDIALALAIIRPAAYEARMNMSENDLVYDDDAIRMLSELIGCDYDEADKHRREISKGDYSIFQHLKLDDSTKTVEVLKNLRKYGFCKAHAYSYAQLVWNLAYEKVHRPKRFWRATLKHCKSSYRKWVHIYLARQHDVFPSSTHASIYAVNRRKKISGLNIYQQLRTYGYWEMRTKDFFPECYLREIDDEAIEFRGLIASSRTISKTKTLIFLGYDTDKFLEIIATHDGSNPLGSGHIGMLGTGTLHDHCDSSTYKYF